MTFLDRDPGRRRRRSTAPPTAASRTCRSAGCGSPATAGARPGTEALDVYSDLKTVYINHDPGARLSRARVRARRADPRPRAGSKRVPGKNVRALGGHPLLAYTIAAARRERRVRRGDRLDRLARRSRRSRGTTAPRCRSCGPETLAGDTSPDIEWVEHTLDELARGGPRVRAASRSCGRPARSGAPARSAAPGRSSRPRATASTRCARSRSARSIPGKMWVLDGERMRPLLPQADGRRAAGTHASTRRCREVYVQNASLEIAWTRVVAERRHDRRRRVVPFFTEGHEGFAINDPTTGCAPSACVDSGAARAARGRREPLTSDGVAMSDDAPLRPGCRARADPRGSTSTPSRARPRFADACRINTLYMIAARRLGPHRHQLQLASTCCLVAAPRGARASGDLYFSSKGHDAPALYAVLIGLGRLPFELLHRAAPARRAARASGRASTPRCRRTPARSAWASPRRKGFVLANRLAGRRGRRLRADRRRRAAGRPVLGVARRAPSTADLGEITVIVDHNKIQSDTWVDRGQRPRRPRGASSRRSAGRSRAATATTSARSRALCAPRADATGRPKVLIADTVKGTGVSFMEPHDLPREATRSTASTAARRRRASTTRGLDELRRTADRAPRSRSAPTPVRAGGGRAAARAGAPAQPQRLVPAYGEALVDAGRARPSASWRSTPTWSSTAA